ncbi:hypothetical protein ACNAW0_11055 [Micromonospora sp. SL1-18]|uniref:hypothetical protein n=1 Tax=Micromonospora sp. SL1-18 TaxID=3399128 RepID=UPI003A4DF25C
MAWVNRQMAEMPAVRHLSLEACLLVAALPRVRSAKRHHAMDEYGEQPDRAIRKYHLTLQL